MRSLWLVVCLASAAAAQDKWTLRELRDRLEVADPKALDEIGRRGKNVAILEPYVRPLIGKDWRAAWALARMGARTPETLKLLAKHIEEPAAQEALARAGKPAVPLVAAQIGTNRKAALRVLTRLGRDAYLALLRLAQSGDEEAEKILLAQIPETFKDLLKSPERDDDLEPLMHLGGGFPPGISEPTRKLAAMGAKAVPRLIAALPHPRAIYALALIGRKAVLAEWPLYLLAKAGKPGTRAAIWALGHIGARTDETIALLRQGLYESRKRWVKIDHVLAAQSLIRSDRWTRSGYSGVYSLYRIASLEITPPLRVFALRSLCLATPRQMSDYILETLRKLMRDKSDRVAAAAAFAYLRFRDRGGSRFWRIVDIYRRTRDNRVRVQIVEDVDKLPFFHSSARKFLIDVAQDDDPVLRKEAAHALGKTGFKDTKAFRALLVLSNDAGEVRDAALRSLARHEHTPNAEDYRGFPGATGLLRHRAPRNETELDLALGMDASYDPGEDLLPQLRAALKSPVAKKRARAAQILGRLGRIDGIDALFLDPDVHVRLAAWRALGE